MAVNIFTKLIICVCITRVIAWNLPPETDQLRSLTNQIENIKSTLNQANIPSYNYNYGPPVPWDTNRNSDYDRFLEQHYIIPILNSLNDISGKITKIIKDKTQDQNFNVPFSMNIPRRPNFGAIADNYSPFNGPTVSGWGSASYNSESQNQGSGSGYSGFPIPLSVSSSNAGGYGLFTPAKPQSHGIYSGDSSGPPVIPSRFPSVLNRQPEEYDDNRNWGLVEDNDSDKKSITLKPTPKPPQCDCEEQNKNITSLALKLKLKSSESNPATCKAVILLCCIPENSEEHRKDCFTEQGCPKSYSTGIACLPIVIQAVFKDIYGNV